MTQFYKIKRVHVKDDPGCVPAYWVESTAQLNVEDPEDKPQPGYAHPTLNLEELPQDGAITRIVEDLVQSDDPEIVISIHGFNNPTKAALKRFAEAYEYANKEPCIRGRKGLVCIGYHWPSECLGKPFPSSVKSAPFFLIGLLCLLPILLIGSLAIWYAQSLPLWVRCLGLLLYIVGLLLVSIPVVTVILRTSAYFRDGYRAMHYGVPDLIEMIRDIEKRLRTECKQKVKLSFIGHSMGGFVVTHLVRIMSDVFNPDPPNEDKARTDESKNSGWHDEANRNIGEKMILDRLVLVSPDIPAEMLMTHRANFLGPSLRRFREAYLFSSGGDMVLGMISAVANHFSFPTSDSRHGYRLGNVEVVNKDFPDKLPSKYGIVNLDEGLCADEPVVQFLRRLRAGELTLARLDEVIGEDPVVRTAREAESCRKFELPECFTYIDCTDYTEDGVHYLSRSKHAAKLRFYNRLSLLITYGLGCLNPRFGPDVHSGYFDGHTMRHMIYGVACLGFRGFLCAQLGSSGSCSDREALEALEKQCQEKRIKVVLSPVLLRDTRNRIHPECP